MSFRREAVIATNTARADASQQVSERVPLGTAR